MFSTLFNFLVMDKQPKAYIVRFLCDGTVSEIPSNWLTDRNHCWWPTKTRNPVSLMNKDLIPKEDGNFRIFEVEIEKECSTILSARKFLNDESYRTTDTEGTSSGRGKRIKKRRPFLNAVDSTSEDEERAYTPPPKLSKIMAEETNNNNESPVRDEVYSPSHRHITDSDSGSLSRNAAVSPRGSVSSPCRGNSGEIQQNSGDIPTLNKILNTCASINITLQDIDLRLRRIEETNITHHHHLPASDFDYSELDKLIPVASIEETTNLENFISNEIKLFVWRYYSLRILMKCNLNRPAVNGSVKLNSGTQGSLLSKDELTWSRLKNYYFVGFELVFETLKKQQPNASKRCKIISGDLCREDLGISVEDRLVLQEEVEFIYHSAASTRFDDSVRVALITNTRSTKYVLDLAGQCKKLKAVMYISTAYAFPKEKVVYERAYKGPVDVHKALDVLAKESEEECEKLLGNYPNTYSLSKALAEQLVVEKMDSLPAIIVRPSVVCPTLKEPIVGWVNNLQGPMGLFVGAGKGIIRSMYMKGDSYADFVPADMVINAILVTTWNFLSNSKKEQFYNLTTSSDYNFSWEEVVEMGKKIIFNDVPFNGVVWYPGGSMKRTRFMHNICFYLFQLLPAIFIDLLLIILGYKPILYQIQRRIQKGSDVFEYYTNRTWNFSNLKIIETREKLNAREKQLYKMDGEGVDVMLYLKECLLAVRRNNLKETDDTIPAAKRHMKVMWFVDILCKTIFILATLYYTYKWVVTPIFRI